MASRHRCVFLALATSVVVLSAGGCSSFTVDDAGVTQPGDGGGADASADANVDAAAPPDTNGCPTGIVFEDGFDTGTASSQWMPKASGGGMFSDNVPGSFVASVTNVSGDSATIDHRFPLPNPSKLVCITLRVRLEGDPARFSGGYVVTMQTDVRANKSDTVEGFLGFGLDKGGVFTNIQDSHGPSQSGRMMMSTMPGAPLSTVVYKIESNGTSSLVTILVDGARADQRTLQLLPQVGDIDLELGPDTSSTNGGFGAVTFTLDSVAVTAE